MENPSTITPAKESPARSKLMQFAFNKSSTTSPNQNSKMSTPKPQTPKVTNSITSPQNFITPKKSSIEVQMISDISEDSDTPCKPQLPVQRKVPEKPVIVADSKLIRTSSVTFFFSFFFFEFFNHIYFFSQKLCNILRTDHQFDVVVFDLPVAQFVVSGRVGIEKRTKQGEFVNLLNFIYNFFFFQ